MDSFELNKVLGAALGILLFVMGAGFLADAFVPRSDAEHGEAHGAAVAEATETAAEPEEASPVLALLASANADTGMAASRKCMGCHTVEKGGANKLGPNLYDVVDRLIGSHEGFNYSAALAEDKAEGKLWTYANLDHFLLAPKEFAPGTKMSFGGVKSDQERADIIAYLRSLSDAPKPLPEGVAAAAPAAAAPAAEPQQSAQAEPAAPAAAPAAAPLPPGAVATFTAAQATAGEADYAARCAMCHGEALEGTAAPPLAGDYFFERWADAGEFYDYVHTAMPMDEPGALTPTQYTEITAYILSKNGFAPGDAPLPDGDIAAMKTIILEPPAGAAPAAAPAAPAAEPAAPAAPAAEPAAPAADANP